MTSNFLMFISNNFCLFNRTTITSHLSTYHPTFFYNTYLRIVHAKMINLCYRDISLCTLFLEQQILFILIYSGVKSSNFSLKRSFFILNIHPKMVYCEHFFIFKQQQNKKIPKFHIHYH